MGGAYLCLRHMFIFVLLVCFQFYLLQNGPRGGGGDSHLDKNKSRRIKRRAEYRVLGRNLFVGVRDYLLQRERRRITCRMKLNGGDSRINVSTRLANKPLSATVGISLQMYQTTLPLLKVAA